MISYILGQAGNILRHRRNRLTDEQILGLLKQIKMLEREREALISYLGRTLASLAKERARIMSRARPHLHILATIESKLELVRIIRNRLLDGYFEDD